MNNIAIVQVLQDKLLSLFKVKLQSRNTHENLRQTKPKEQIIRKISHKSSHTAVADFQLACYHTKTDCHVYKRIRMGFASQL
jgi:hypothetical protein